MGSAPDRREVVAGQRALFVDLVGTEISAIWRNVTRLGGQCVAALYLWNEPRSMDDLASELGRSKSNVFANLKALQSLGIVRRVRVSGSARDHYELGAEYPDILVIAFARHLSNTLKDKSTELSSVARQLEELAEEEREREVARRVARLADTYATVGALIDGLLPAAGEAHDLVSILGRITPDLVHKAVKLLGTTRR